MAAKKQPADSMRRTPRQNRAKATLEAIFEASARILEREGRHALNTNHIAERAGIGIGTLYQYFPNKQAILVAMARAQVASDGAAVMNALAKTASSEPDRIAIRALISAFEKRWKTRRAVIDTLVAEGLGHERAKSVQAVAGMIAARSRQLLPARTTALSPTAIFVITRAVNGVLRATVEEESPVLKTREFEDELVRLVRGYLAGAS